MKTHTPSHLSTRPLSHLVLAVTAGVALSSLAQASTVYWGGPTNGAWGTLADWNTAADGSGSAPTTAPGAGDDVVYNISTLNSDQKTYLSGNQSVNSLTFNNTGSSTVDGNGNTLTIGSGGVTVASTAGGASLGSWDNTVILLGASQSWNFNNNNGASATIVRAAGSTPTTLTVNVNGSGFGSTLGTLNNSTTAGGVVSLVVNAGVDPLKQIGYAGSLSI